MGNELNSDMLNKIAGTATTDTTTSKYIFTAPADSIQVTLSEDANADEAINSPDHYQSSTGIECIDAIEAATEELMGLEAVCTANIIKYAWRWKKKGKPVEDIKKIKKYCDILLEYFGE